MQDLQRPLCAIRIRERAIGIAHAVAVLVHEARSSTHAPVPRSWAVTAARPLAHAATACLPQLHAIAHAVTILVPRSKAGLER